MDAELLREKLPEVESWINRTLNSYEQDTRPVSSFQFPRLAHFYPLALLQTVKVVVVPSVPVPPLSQMGLPGFSDFEGMHMEGITFLDTYFIRTDCQQNEPLHFHELVHVVQWQRLGMANFILAYALGHALEGGYDGNPLEKSAYALQDRFEAGEESFDAAAVARTDVERDFLRLLKKAGLA